MNPRKTGGFSLLELTITIAITSFALVALIGVLPFGLRQSRTSVDETRAAQLCRMVFSTLESEPFTAAKCFAPAGIPPLDLSRIPAVGGDYATVLFASYDLQQNTAIVRADQPPTDAEYQIELRFSPVAFRASERGGAVRGILIGFKVSRLGSRFDVIMSGTHFVSRLAPGAQVEAMTSMSPP